MPLQMYVNPVVTGRDAAGRVHEVGGRSRRTRTRSIPQTIAAQRNDVDQGVDRPRGAMTRATRRARASRVAVPLGFLAVFFAWPLGAIFARSLRPGAIRDVAHRPRACGTSCGSRCGRRCVSTVLTLVVGLPAAYVVARYDFPGERAVPRVRHRAVRAADGRGRDRVPRVAAAGRTARVPALAARASRRCWSRTCSSTSRWSCAPSAASGRTSIRAARKRRGCSARRGRRRSAT